MKNFKRDKKSFIHTFMGGKCWPLRPKPEDLDIVSIAHSLACTNRFNGHSPYPYSVAQHSVLVSYLCDPEVALEGLMHDATEAYIGDMVQPVKRHFPQFEESESLLWECIAKTFGLDPGPFHPSILEADIRMLATEARDLFGGTWQGKVQVAPFEHVRVIPVGWRKAKKMFLKRFLTLKRLRDLKDKDND